MKHSIRYFAILFLAMPIGCDAGPPVRHLPLEGAANFRDLGGYVVDGGKRVRWGMLYRSDALNGLTEQDQQLLTRLNISKITDFRNDFEVQRNPDRLPPSLAARSVRIPLDYRPTEVARSDPEPEQARNSEVSSEQKQLERIDRMLLEVYPRFVRESQPQYRLWLQGLLDGSADSAQVFHCTGGADRTGFASAIFLLALGVSREQVMQDYLLTNQFLYSPEGRQILDQRMTSKLPAGVHVDARYLDAALDAAVKDYGSIDNYLRVGLGIDDVMLYRLQDRYLESSQ